jgi:hypothetical protein
MARQTLKALRTDAGKMGLFVLYYNPGDNPQYKVTTRDVDFHAPTAGQTLFRGSKLSAVGFFLDGYFAGLRDGKLRGANEALRDAAAESLALAE